VKCAKNEFINANGIKMNFEKASQSILESVLSKNQFQNMISRLKKDAKTGHQMQLIIFQNQIFENGIDLLAAKNYQMISV